MGGGGRGRGGVGAWGRGGVWVGVGGGRMQRVSVSTGVHLRQQTAFNCYNTKILIFNIHLHIAQLLTGRETDGRDSDVRGLSPSPWT